MVFGEKGKMKIQIILLTQENKLLINKIFMARIRRLSCSSVELGYL